MRERVVQAGASRKSEIGGRHGVRMGESPGFARYWRLRLLRGGPVTSWGVREVWRELAVTHDKSCGSARGGALACAPDLSPQAPWCRSHEPQVPIHHGTTRSFYRDTAGPIGEIICTRAVNNRIMNIMISNTYNEEIM